MQTQEPLIHTPCRISTLFAAAFPASPSVKGFFACSLIGVVPIELYKFCISLQNTFSHDLARIFAGTQSLDLAGQSTSVLQGSFMVAATAEYKLFNLLAMIAFAYCIIKIFFQNIKRGGILLVQMSVGALYMFSVPRGYSSNSMHPCGKREKAQNPDSMKFSPYLTDCKITRWNMTTSSSVRLSNALWWNQKRKSRWSLSAAPKSR